MVEMHRTILESMMDGFASIINNNECYYEIFGCNYNYPFQFPTK